MTRVQATRYETERSRERSQLLGQATVVDRRLARGVAVALLASLPVWGGLIYLLTA